MRPFRIPRWRVATLGLLLVTSVCSGQTIENRFKVIRTIDARFPPSLLMERIIHGEAWIMITIDETGRLSDALVTKYTHELIAKEALRVIKAWRYEAATSKGKPVPIRTEIKLTFEATGAVLSLDAASTVKALTAFADRTTYVSKICPPSELDAPPVALRTVTPSHPGSKLGSSVAEAQTVLSFIIDEEGTPRMPVLVSATDVELANRAVDALAQWQFSRPTRRGVPVAVHVQQAFVFGEGS
jgi:TonB family protein